MQAEVMRNTRNPTLNPGCRLEHELVRIAPTPVLSGLEALDDRVASPVKMLCRMLVGRRIAAAHVSAAEAEPQMHPPGPGLEAFLATLRCGGLNLVDLAEMSALHCFRSSAPRSHPPRSAPAS
jgi:hypothetical protein